MKRGMKYKRLFLILFVTLLSLGLNAKNTGRVVATLTLNDGIVIHGFASINSSGDKVTIEDIHKRKVSKFSSEKIKSLVIPPSGDDTTIVTYIPILVHQPWYPGKESQKPKMVTKVFDSHYVEGYTGVETDYAYTGSASFSYAVNTYYYRIKGEMRAYGYWKDINFSGFNLKKFLKYYLKRFPGIIDFINSNGIEKKAFLENPTMIMPLIDEAVRSGNYQIIEEK
ncbi:MAG: hypothetical protein J5980_06430 [Muribaculaceae bacterium]|nr:hypothetical protein [Muribaculaceae bacterium]